MFIDLQLIAHLYIEEEIIRNIRKQISFNILLIARPALISAPTIRGILSINILLPDKYSCYIDNGFRASIRPSIHFGRNIWCC